ncbi:MAG: PLP-dependent aminotransferase family protein [Rhodococcus sp.]|nr:PLP-dependent aminotransferase family protein [Rhodococcus sp. (in: high G+C Gram-positive bacteria)]
MNDGSSAARVAGELRAWIRERPAGAKLPSTRILAGEYQVGPVTVQSALQLLVADGLVETRPGVGTFIAATRQARPVDVSWQTTALGWSDVFDVEGSGVRTHAPDVIGLHTGYPSPSLLPGALLRSAVQKVSRDPEILMSAAPASGLPQLRAWFARDLDGQRTGGSGIDESDVIVTSGGQSALSASLRALAAPGEAIIVESPTYWGAMAAAKAHGLRMIPIARTKDGIDPADLDAALAAHGSRVFYAQPTYANPTGDVWSPHVRAEVMQVLAARKAFLVEDDWARDLYYDAEPLPPIAAADENGHVVYIRSLTKSLSPAIRVAGLVARGPALRRIRSSRWVSELFVPPFTQQVAVDVLAHPGWNRHRAALRRELRTRRDELRAQLTRAVPEVEVTQVPRGGLSLWVRLPRGHHAAEVAERALTLGLAISPGSEWFPTEPYDQFIRMSFAATPHTRYVEAANILAEVLR